ncbi:unnamed protein product [Adineta steineri]|uniref:SGNH hydrolase-type esterase domain-containing protein n=1 Tax=Adineta steineri TaxID=433720 RepID=A0A819WSK5_9BILA|nr:unnamed protein product [Adineta steineri]CAF4131201.1 unnamed protein product [Adineta steineri]
MKNFIDKEEQKLLWSNICKENWSKELTRDTLHYGQRYDYETRKLVNDAKEIPEWLNDVKKQVEIRANFENSIDQIIINRYKKGQSISPHIDHKVLFGSTIATLSLGAENTHNQVHRPQLESPPLANTSTTASSEVSSQIDTVLLGDSMMERFKTTGKHTQVGQLRYPQVFNAGVGGDRIENVLYRIDLGLLRLLKHKNPKLVVLQVGTNNLRPGKALQFQHLNGYCLLLHALLRTLSTETQILVTGLFRRTDIDEQCITHSNMALKELVTKINEEEMRREAQPSSRVHWMDSPGDIGLEHLDDHVHLNINGYQIWNAVLQQKIQELLSAYNPK